MKRVLFALVMVLGIAAGASAQFTIPNNDVAANSNQSIWMKADIDAIVAGVHGNGVYAGMAVTPSSGMTLTVAKGPGLYLGAGIWNFSNTNVTLAAADIHNPRIDLVIGTVSGFTVTATSVTGVPAVNPGAPNIPANSVLLAMVYVPANATVISANLITDKRMILGTLPSIFRVTDFGALCDGLTDDSVALQAAFTAADNAGGGTVVLPDNTCVFGTPLVIGGSTGHYTNVNLVGQGENLSLLTYTGDNTKTAITLSHVAYFFWKDLQVAFFGTKNTSVGVKLTGPFHGAGTQTLSGYFEQVRFQGFHIGLQAGDGSAGEDEASEIVWNKCIFAGNDIGWTDSGFNSLNFVLWNVSIGGNQIGVSLGGYGGFGNWTGGSVLIDGADSVNNTVADIAGGNTFGHAIIRHVRTESTVPLALGTFDYLTIEDCEVTDNTVGHFAINLGFNSGLQLYRCSSNIPFKVTSAGNNSTMIVEGNIATQGSAGYPVDFSAMNVGNNGIHASFRNNRKNGPPFFATSFSDVDGWFIGGSQGTEFIVERSDNGPLNAGYNLPFARALGYGSTVLGKNLRDRVTFATSATSAYTFVRSVTVSVANSKTITFTANAITAADIGKKIVIQNATSLCNPAGNGDVTAFINTVPSTTTAVVTPLGHDTTFTCENNINRTVGGLTATVGENEPDANYFLALGCDTNGETIKWGSKATTGFTLTSSNASSTAKCDVMIVR